MIAITSPRPPPPIASPPPRPIDDRPRTSVTCDGSRRAFGSNVIGSGLRARGAPELYPMRGPGGSLDQPSTRANRLAGGARDAASVVAGIAAKSTPFDHS